MAREQKVMRIEASVSARSSKGLVEREQLVQQSSSAAPMPYEEQRWPEIELVKGAPVQPLLEHPQRRQHAAGQAEAQFQRAIDRFTMAAADTAPCGEIQIEYRP